MRKRFITSKRPIAIRPEAQWLDLDRLSVVEVTSEDPSHPVESAVAGRSGGWIAAEPGEKIIRIILDHPQRVTRIFVTFEEREFQCTQEFVLRWSPGIDGPYREIVRPQWNFSPPGTVVEREDYKADLPNVAVLELYAIPDKNGGRRRASLVEWHVGVISAQC